MVCNKWQVVMTSIYLSFQKLVSNELICLIYLQPWYWYLKWMIYLQNYRKLCGSYLKYIHFIYLWNQEQIWLVISIWTWRSILNSAFLCLFILLRSIMFSYLWRTQNQFIFIYNFDNVRSFSFITVIWNIVICISVFIWF